MELMIPAATCTKTQHYFAVWNIVNISIGFPLLQWGIKQLCPLPVLKPNLDGTPNKTI